VLEVVRAAVRDPGGVTRVELADRKHMLRVAVPLKLGEMGENRFQAGHYWRQHFAKRIAQQGVAAQPLTVKKLREWMNDPTPMGLLPGLEDLVVLTFAEQTDRYLTFHETPIQPEIGELNEGAVLHETELPASDAWTRARERGKAVFGVDSSPLLNAGNLASLAASIRTVIGEHRAAVRALPGCLRKVRTQVWPEITQCGRFETATEVESLALPIEQARSEVDSIKRLAGAQLRATAAVLGASLKSAGTVIEVLEGYDWVVLSGIRALADDRKAEADQIWQELEECFTSDELAVALAPKFGALRTRAINLLTRPVAPPQPPLPPPQVPPALPPPLPPVTPPALELKRLYQRSQVEGDDLPDWVTGELAVEVLQVHCIQPTSFGASQDRSTMVVVTPTLERLLQLDPGAVIDLEKREVFLPRFDRRLKLSVSPQHNG
jgi:hypothetical protein